MQTNLVANDSLAHYTGQLHLLDFEVFLLVLNFFWEDFVNGNNGLNWEEGGFDNLGFVGSTVCSRFLQGAGTDPEDVAQIREALERNTSYCGRLLNYKKDGTPFWNLLTIAPIKDETGKVLKFIGLVSFFLDIFFLLIFEC